MVKTDATRCRWSGSMYLPRLKDACVFPLHYALLSGQQQHRNGKLS